MKKRTLLVIILLQLIVVGGVGWYLFSRTEREQEIAGLPDAGLLPATPPPPPFLPTQDE